MVRAFYTVQQMTARCAEAAKLGFQQVPGHERLSLLQKREAANGEGPDAVPTPARRLVTALLPFGDLAADGHDATFQFLNDGTEATWHAANRFWYENSLRWIAANRSRWNPRRYVEQCLAWSGYKLLLEGKVGREAWDAAFKKYGIVEEGPERLSGDASKGS